MKYMLDTNICIYIIKQRPEQVIKKFKSINVGEIAISSITLAELMYGVGKSQHHMKNKNALMKFVLPLEIVSFDDHAALHYGHIRAALETKGAVIGALDLMIAAHARSLGLIVVSNNGKEFTRVPKLRVQNWL